MRTNLATASPSHEVPDCDGVRPRMAKAALTVTPSHTVLRDVIARVVKGASMKKEALAAEMGKDRAQMYRQLDNGHLTVEDVDSLGPDLLVTVAEELLQRVGPLATPKARAKQRIRDARALLDELDQFVEGA